MLTSPDLSLSCNVLKLKYVNLYLPVSEMLHLAPRSIIFPSQNVSLVAGFVSEQDRVLTRSNLKPPTHLNVQLLHGDQAVNPPSGTYFCPSEYLKRKKKLK